MSDLTLRWTFQTDSQGTGTQRAVTPDITVDRGVVYVGSKRGTMYAIDAQSGKELWSTNVRSRVDSQVAVSEDGATIFFGTAAEGLYALDTDSGSKLWNYKSDAYARGFDVKPTIYKDTVIAPSSSGRIFAFNGDRESDNFEKPEVKWIYPKPPSKEIQGNFREAGTAHEDAYYVGSDDGTLYGMRISTGIVHSKARKLGEKMPYYDVDVDEDPVAIRSQIARYDDELYFGNEDDRIFKYTRYRFKWVYTADRPIRGSIAAAEDIVIAADTTGKIYGLNPDETKAERLREIDNYDSPQVLWTEFTDAKARIAGGPIIAGDWAYVIDQLGMLYMIDIDRGRIVYSLDLWPGTSPCQLCKSTPAIEGNMLYAGTQEGTIVGIQLPEHTR